VGLAPEIANADGQAVPGISAALAIDSQGKHHLVWATPSGLFYSTDAGGSFTDPDKVTTGPSYGASIAVASDATTWISWYGGGSLNVAHGRAGSWTVDHVSVNAGPATGPAVASSIRLTKNGDPFVAFDDHGRTVVASQPGISWQTASIPGDGGYGVSLGLEQDGTPHVAYYDAGGGIHEAHPEGTSWAVTDLGTTTSGTPGQPDAGWSTGMAVDDQGVNYVTWADTSGSQVMLATNQNGSFGTQPVLGGEGGINPSLAVSGDGKTLAIAWFDAVNTNLDVAVPSSGGLVLAHPLPTLAQPSVTAQPTQSSGGPPPCEPDGTTLAIAAQNSAFDKDCLAAPAGQAFTIDFTNDDAGVPHNVDIYDQQGGTHLGGAAPTEFFTGPGTTTYDVDALDAGTYFFQCDVHPTAMFGTFVVVKAS
jgi:plastocyanin